MVLTVTKKMHWEKFKHKILPLPAHSCLLSSKHCLNLWSQTNNSHRGKTEHMTWSGQCDRRYVYSTSETFIGSFPLTPWFTTVTWPPEYYGGYKRELCVLVYVGCIDEVYQPFSSHNSKDRALEYINRLYKDNIQYRSACMGHITHS